MAQRVVITGLGSIAPNGTSMHEVWEGCLAGRSGVGPITLYDASTFPTRVAGQVPEFDPSTVMDKKEVRRSDRFLQFVNMACSEALRDAGLEPGAFDPFRVGVVAASGIGGIGLLEEQARILFEKGNDRVSPFFVPMMIIDMAAGDLSIRHGFKGPNFCTVSACSSGAHALLDAWNLLQLGYADVVIAGGTEAPVTALAMAGFCQMRAMTTRNDEPERASRPFDAERDGFVISEGAGIAVLETLEHARKRGARIHAEFAGGGMTADAHHLTAPDPEGAGATESMRMALRMAGVEPGEVGYINAHGTSTAYNDAIESKAIRNVFGDTADAINVSSTKSMMGHLLGASGAVEFNLITLAVEHGMIPPTINYENPDPACTLNYTPNASVPRALEVALSNSFGFGGHNVTLAVRRFDE